MNFNSKMLAVIIMAPARIGLSSQTFLRESVSITILFKCAHDGKQKISATKKIEDGDS